MRRLAYRLWSGEPWRRFAIEATAMVLAAWSFILLYGAGIESRVLFYTVEAIATVLVVDFLGFAAMFYWEGK